MDRLEVLVAGKAVRPRSQLDLCAVRGSHLPTLVNTPTPVQRSDSMTGHHSAQGAAQRSGGVEVLLLPVVGAVPLQIDPRRTQ